MTVTYTYKVANARLCGFTRLLFYWKGSIYKILYKEMLIYLAVYFVLSVLYRFLLNPEQRTTFERVVLYCQEFTNLIPVSFVLGFYIALVVGRWWNQFMNVPWPDRVMTNVTAFLHGMDERSRMMRRTIVRYVNLTSILLFRSVSVPVAKRFPSMDHIIEAGMLTEEESKLFDDMQSVHSKYWVPCQWAMNIASQARQEGRIKDDIHLKTIIDEINAFRGCCGQIINYDWISIPLVYTQTTTLAVYTYFLASVIGSQYLDPAKDYRGHEVDLYVPVFNMLQFFFYMGWIKVAEQLINPFGEDDDDFETNLVIDRNIQVAFLCVDDMYMSFPELTKDAFWDDVEAMLPYTKSSASTQRGTYLGSTANLHFDGQDAQFICSMDTIHEQRSQTGSPMPSTTIPIPRTVISSPKKPHSWLMSNLSESGRLSHLSLRPDEPWLGHADEKIDYSSSAASTYREQWPSHANGSRFDSNVVNSSFYINSLVNDSEQTGPKPPSGPNIGREENHHANHDGAKKGTFPNEKWKNLVQDTSNDKTMETPEAENDATDVKKVTFQMDVSKSDAASAYQNSHTSSTAGLEPDKVHVEVNSDGEEIYTPIPNPNTDSVNSLTPLLDT